MSQTVLDDSATSFEVIEAIAQTEFAQDDEETKKSKKDKRERRRRHSHNDEAEANRFASTTSEAVSVTELEPIVSTQQQQSRQKTIKNSAGLMSKRVPTSPVRSAFHTQLTTEPGPSNRPPLYNSIDVDDDTFETMNAFDLLPPTREQLEIDDTFLASSLNSPTGGGGAVSGVIDEMPSSPNDGTNFDYLVSLLPPTTVEAPNIPAEDPIVIRGNGNITLFGLSNSFSNAFPSNLLGRVSREEFDYTMSSINELLRQQHSTNAKFLILGCLCCCCSLGCSVLWPTFALSKRTRSSLEKLLAMENSRLYHKLGLNWRLAKQQSHTNHSFMEYILVVDFMPKLQIYQPD